MKNNILFCANMEEYKQAVLGDNKKLDGDASLNYDESEFGDNIQLSINGNMAFIEARGSLVDSDFSWFGIPYKQLANCFATVTANTDVDRVVFNFETGGGTSSGIDKAANAFDAMCANKQVDVFTSSSLCSAGYYIACSADSINSSKMAHVGSIGAIGIIYDDTKMLEDYGIMRYVFKSGKFKAVGVPGKDGISDDELERIQDNLNDSAKVFFDRVRNKRPSVADVCYKEADAYIPTRALNYGLLDSVCSLAELINNRGSDAMKKKQVTQSMFDAVVSAGGSPTNLEVISDEEYANLENEPEEQQEQTSEEPEQSMDAAGGEEQEPVDDAEATEMSELREQVAELADVKTKLEESEKMIDELSTNLNTAMELITARLSDLRIGLGFPDIDLSNMSVDTVLKDYTALNEQFAQQYQASVKPENSDKETKPKMSFADRVKAQAVFGNKKK